MLQLPAIEPTHAPPLTRSPMTEAGCPPISTVGTQGEMIGSPANVKSPSLAAGKDISDLS